MTDHDLERRVQQATEPLAEWLGGVGDRLVDFFVCEVRPVATSELARLPHTPSVFGPASPEGSFAAVPASDEAATLVVLRHELMTGTGVTLFFGDLAHEAVPCCDECALLPQSEDDRDDLVAQAEMAVWVATRGFAEFRRVADDGAGDPEPWFEEGWIASQGGASWSSAAVPAEPLTRVWRPWLRRRDALPRASGGVPVVRDASSRDGGYGPPAPTPSPGFAAPEA
ncbi:hypothetical protein [Nocardioides marmoraquaticus]